MRASASASRSGSGSPASSSSSAPSCERFIASAPRASAATSSSEAPPFAEAAAATAPSTRGASLSRTREPSSTISVAISALMSALPRSISTSTPSSDSARSMAACTRVASVPTEPSSIPPAASIFTSSPPISRASSTTPSASEALWETTTSPTMGARYNPYARCNSSSGCTEGRWVAFAICQRQVSLSQTTLCAPDASTWLNRSAPTFIAMSYFSRLIP